MNRIKRYLIFVSLLVLLTRTSLSQCIVCPSLIREHALYYIWLIVFYFWNIIKVMLKVDMCRLMTKPTKCHVRPAKTLIGLGGCPEWSESSLGAHDILLGFSCGGHKCKGFSSQIVNSFFCLWSSINASINNYMHHISNNYIYLCTQLWFLLLTRWT